MDTLTPQPALDVLLLAGEGESSYKVYHQHKAFLHLQGKTIVSHVLESLHRVPSVRSIYLIGQKDSLRRTLAEDGVPLDAPKPVHLLQQRENLYQNIWHAFLATLPEPVPEAELETSPYADRAVLIVPCDAPLITPHEVEYFIRKSDLTRYDHILGLTPESCLKPFYPEGGRPGIRMAYLHLKEGNFRINNLHLVRPVRIGNRRYIQEMYQYRYQRNIRNVIPFALKLLLRDRYHGYRLYLGLVLSLLAARWHCPRLEACFRNWVPKAALERWVSQGLATRFFGLTVPFPGAALDIDNEEDFRALEARFEEWRGRIRQMEQAHPLPPPATTPGPAVTPAL